MQCTVQFSKAILRFEMQCTVSIIWTNKEMQILINSLLQFVQILSYKKLILKVRIPKTCEGREGKGKKIRSFRKDNDNKKINP